MAPTVITTGPGVEELADRVRGAGRFALDFEFLWERTYRPVPCLAQVAVDDDVLVLDPIAGAPLDAIADLVADPAVATIMHAPVADLTLLAMHFGTRPAAVADVQLTAGFVGLGAGQSLATLLERTLRVRLTKTESFSDWSRRPLTRAQLNYADADVRHLIQMHDELMRRAEELDRVGWVHEEHERRYGPDARFVTDPDEAWRKVKGHGRLNGRERAVLRALAAWRERAADRRDRPAGWLAQDRVLVDLARRRPATAPELESTRVSDRLRSDDVNALLQAIRDGEAADEVRSAPGTPPDLADRIDVLGSLGQLIVATRAAAARLAAPLLATRGEIEAFLTDVVRGRGPTGPLADGWRRAIAGEALVALAEGRLAVRPDPRPPYLVEVPQGDGDVTQAALATGADDAP